MSIPADTPRRTALPPIEVRAIGAGDRDWLRALLTADWGSAVMVTRGRRHEADRLPGFVALAGGDRAGVLLYTLHVLPPGIELEIVLLQSLWEQRGIGTALLAAAERTARARRCRRLWLVTTNDNVPAIGFYERRGFSLVAIHRDAVTAARLIKPEIPLVGLGGAPIRDEIELERQLNG